MEKQYANEVAGFNNRMTDIHAAIGRVQLGKLPGWTATRQENAAFFDANLAGVVTPVVREGASHVYHQYTVRIEGATAVGAGCVRDRAAGGASGGVRGVLPDAGAPPGHVPDGGGSAGDGDAGS